MKIIFIDDLKNTEEVEKLCKNSKEPIFVEQDGNIQFVIFDFDYYNELTCRLNEANLVNEGLEDIQNGKVVDGEIIRTRLKKKL